MRGIYRIHGVAVCRTGREQGAGSGVIERCVGYTAANGGRTLWCCAPLTAVHIWRRYGFAIAGPPFRARGSIDVVMMRPLTVTDNR